MGDKRDYSPMFAIELLSRLREMLDRLIRFERGANRDETSLSPSY